MNALGDPIYDWRKVTLLDSEPLEDVAVSAMHHELPHGSLFMARRRTNDPDLWCISGTEVRLPGHVYAYAPCGLHAASQRGELPMKLCIYHAPCNDGFAAAWVVRRVEPAVEFHAGRHGNAPPDVTGRDVVLVDFSYPRRVLIAMAAQATSILVIDHHKTAEDDLVDLPANVTTVFDRKHSGAMLAWRYYFPEETPPALLCYVEDQGLWRHALPGSREVNAAIFSYPYTMETWDDLMVRPIHELHREGAPILRKQRKGLEEMVPALCRRMSIAGHDVPAINLPYIYASEAAGMLANGEPFAACYWDGPDGRHFSLCSTVHGLDVAAIAAQFGGGGHEHAAGFRVSYLHPLTAGQAHVFVQPGAPDNLLVKHPSASGVPHG